MNRRSKPLLGALAVALSADAATGWVQIIPAGTFAARDGRGPFLAGGRESLEEILTATRTWLSATDMPVDYEHQTLRAAENGKPAPAAGWVREFEVRDDGLWGRVEWTAAAAAAIKAGEYRYLSPVFSHDKGGRITRVRMAALTNTPAADLAEVEALAARLSSNEDTDMDKIIALLGLAAGSTEAAVLAAITKLMEGTSSVALAAGLEKDAAAEEVALAVKEAVKNTKPDPAKFVPVEAVTALTSRIDVLQKQITDGAVGKAVEAALTAGRIIPAQKEWATAYAEKDLAGFEAFVATQPVIGSGQKAAARAQDGTLDESDLAVLTQLGIGKEAFVATRKAEAA